MQPVSAATLEAQGENEAKQKGLFQSWFPGMALIASVVRVIVFCPHKELLKPVLLTFITYFASVMFGQDGEAGMVQGSNLLEER